MNIKFRFYCAVMAIYDYVIPNTTESAIAAFTKAEKRLLRAENLAARRVEIAFQRSVAAEKAAEAAKDDMASAIADGGRALRIRERIADLTA